MFVKNVAVDTVQIGMTVRSQGIAASIWRNTLESDEPAGGTRNNEKR